MEFSEERDEEKKVINSDDVKICTGTLFYLMFDYVVAHRTDDDEIYSKSCPSH